MAAALTNRSTQSAPSTPIVPVEAPSSAVSIETVSKALKTQHEEVVATTGQQMLTAAQVTSLESRLVTLASRLATEETARKEAKEESMARQAFLKNEIAQAKQSAEKARAAVTASNHSGYQPSRYSSDGNGCIVM